MHRLLNPLGFAVGSWLFFKAVRAGLAVKRPYLDHNGRASNAEKQPTGRGPEGCVENGSAASLLVSHVSIHSTPAVACSWQAIRRKWADTRDTGRVWKRVECPEQATARRMDQICSFLPPRRRPILNTTKPKGFRRRCTNAPPPKF